MEVQKTQFMRETMVGGPGYGKDMGAYVLGGAGIGAAIATAIGGALKGASLGSAIGGPIGTAIGGAIGGAAALVISEEMKIASDNEERAIDALVEAYEEEGNSAFEHISDILANAGIQNADLLASTLNENIGATQELITALYANAEAT
jgi:gas vesicle protein